MPSLSRLMRLAGALVLALVVVAAGAALDAVTSQDADAWTKASNGRMYLLPGRAARVSARYNAAMAESYGSSGAGYERVTYSDSYGSSGSQPVARMRVFRTAPATRACEGPLCPLSLQLKNENQSLRTELADVRKQNEEMRAAVAEALLEVRAVKQEIADLEAEHEDTYASKVLRLWEQRIGEGDSAVVGSPPTNSDSFRALVAGVF